jgi:2-C-methyl-D-erythritol 2,4-cyclodiphosphate synthase
MFRIGSGHDSHRIVEGRLLTLGGVVIPYHLGLYGHSDADVVMHAITDALLGSIGLGDIGDSFPDTDPQWKDASSSLFLLQTIHKLKTFGWKPINFDVTIFAEKPKLGAHKSEIRDHLAKILEIEPNSINIKAKTGEKVGHIGRGEAISCHAVVLVERVT